MTVAVGTGQKYMFVLNFGQRCPNLNIIERLWLELKARWLKWLKKRECSKNSTVAHGKNQPA